MNFLLAYIFSGLGAGIAAIFWSASFSTVAAATGNGMELDAIAGVYIGGTSAAGGIASISGSVIGSLMLVVIRSGLNFVLAKFNLNLNSTYVTYVLTGIIVVVAVLMDVIKNKNPSSKLICVTDACHSGSMWDIQSGNKNGRVLPDNMISVSAANDKQTAKQTMIDRKEQGIFTSNMCTYLGKKKDASPNEISAELKTALRKYSQTMTVATTTDSLLTSPLFSSGE